MEPVLLNLPDTVHTERLILRVPQAGDGQDLFEAVSESLDELRAYLVSLPWVAAEPAVEASEAFARNGQANFLARRDFPFLMIERATGRLVGATGLHRPVWSTPKVEIGYWVRTSAAGRGLVAEAVEALQAYAFAELGVVRVEIVTDAENLRSRRVAERCGFRLEGVLRHEGRDPRGGLRDTCIYARLRAASEGLVAASASGPPAA